MIKRAPRPFADFLIEAVAAAALGGAVVFAVAQRAAWSLAALGGLVAAAATVLVLRRFEAPARSAEWFEPVAFPGAAEAGELDEEVLLLDDPLPAIDEQSRVVRLFAAQPAENGVEAAPIAGPGEMVARIEDFLGMTRGDAPAAERGAGRTASSSPDAHAALHAALADIRRSLRHG